MILEVILVFVTLAILTAGVVLMGFGGKSNKRLSKKLMVARVVSQLVAIIVVFVMYLYIK